MRLLKRSEKVPTHPSGSGLGRTIAIAIFALAGGFVLAPLAAPILEFIYSLISSRITNSPGEKNFDNILINMLPFALLGGILGGIIGVRFIIWFEKVAVRWDKMELGDKLNLFIGLLLGPVIAIPFILAFQQLRLENTYFLVLILASIVAFSSLTIYALQAMSEFLPWSRARSRSKRSGIKILDTNVIIDGRVYDVSKTGFMGGQIYVPGFVLEELQFIADSHDGQRRQRGRRGLEILKHMQADFPLEVRVHDRLAPDQGDGVDARLVRLAKALGADIVTNDFNLKRVAELQEVKVLSLNDLSLALRPNVLPGEILANLRILREGNQYGQGIGYLEDGTMVVVENGGPHTGETLDVLVTQVHQTEKGKMIFAEVDSEDGPARTRRANRRNS